MLAAPHKCCKSEPGAGSTLRWECCPGGPGRLGWALAVLCSIPQSIVFSLETHPVISSYRQCINTVALTDPDRELLYFLYFFILSWVLPIMVMMVCYVSIIITICRRTKKNILGRLRCQSLGGNMKYGLCPNWF